MARGQLGAIAKDCERVRNTRGKCPVKKCGIPLAPKDVTEDVGVRMVNEACRRLFQWSDEASKIVQKRGRSPGKVQATDELFDSEVYVEREFKRRKTDASEELFDKDMHLGTEREAGRNKLSVGLKRKANETNAKAKRKHYQKGELDVGQYVSRAK